MNKSTMFTITNEAEAIAVIGMDILHIVHQDIDNQIIKIISKRGGADAVGGCVAYQQLPMPGGAMDLWIDFVAEKVAGPMYATQWNYACAYVHGTIPDEVLDRMNLYKANLDADEA